MCKNKIKVRGTYYNCGQCEACRQQLANKRTFFLSNVDTTYFTPYFITLTYSSDYVPFCRKQEIFSAIKSLRNQQKAYFRGDKLDISSLVIPIYRQSDFYFDKKLQKHVRYLPQQPIDYIDLSSLPDYRIRKLIFHDSSNDKPLHGCIKYFNGKPVQLKSVVSIAYHKDFQTFIKNLRQYLFRKFHKNIDLKFYYAPEFGPTTTRFHIHALIYFPKCFSVFQVKNIICDNWRFASRLRTAQYVEPARCASHYVSSYINCDSSISSLLQLLTPLRHRHSFYLFNRYQKFTFDSVYQKVVVQRNYMYKFTSFTTGSPTEVCIPYPKHILDSFFPFIQGYSRFDCNALLYAYVCPEKFFELTDIVDDTFPDLKEKRYFLKNTKASFPIPVITSFSKSTVYNNIRKINSCYDLYFKPRGFSRLDYAHICCNVINGYYSYLLIMQLTEVVNRPPSIYNYFNLDECLSGDIINERVYDYATSLSSILPFEPNNNVLDNISHERLMKQYYKNIKYRKVNSVKTTDIKPYDICQLI